MKKPRENEKRTNINTKVKGKNERKDGPKKKSTTR